MAHSILRLSQAQMTAGICLISLAFGCASSLPIPRTKPDGPMSSDFADGDSLELKQAKTWARVQELEEQVLALQEKVSLLEEGFMLQINPKGAHQGHTEKPDKHLPSKNKPKKEPSSYLNKDASSELMKADEHAKTNENPVSSDQEMTIVYKKRLEVAKGLFEEGKFGNAYLDFSKLDREFSDQMAQGEPKFWIARCWYALKEYQNAKMTFESFISAYKKSDHFVAAKLYIAKSELGLGLTNQARKRLKEIIKEHPYEENAERAKQLLVELSRDFS